MKSPLYALATLFVSIGLFSACSHSANETSFTGIWSYQTLEGNYAELWVTDESLLAIRNPGQRPSVFDYLRSGDTVKIYAQGMAEDGRTPLDRFYIQSRQNGKLIKIQDGITTELTLVEEEQPEMGETEEFEKQVLSDFNSRAAPK
jgi:hypothetical protein